MSRKNGTRGAGRGPHRPDALPLESQAHAGNRSAPTSRLLQVILHPGMWLHKIPSNRDAQVAGFDKTYVYLTWDDDGRQTRVRRDRLNRTNEWKLANA